MEADWTVALAAGDPVITIPWECPSGCGFVDLRLAPNRVDEIAEIHESPALRSTLLQLNGPVSPFYTVKCDAWTSGPEEGAPQYDPYEMDANPGETAFGAGSYIDLMHLDSKFRSSFERQENWVRRVIAALRALLAKSARVELVVRHAQLQDHAGFAITWFVEGCGQTRQQAQQRWEAAICAALPVLIATPETIQSSQGASSSIG